MPITSANIDSLCAHSDSQHTYRNELINHFAGIYTGNNKTTNALWSGHRIITDGVVDKDGNPEENRSCSTGTSVFLLNVYESNRMISSQSVLLHELNHQYDIHDHYHKSTEDNMCENAAICSDCNPNGRPKSCIMYKHKTITNPDIICDQCAIEIIIHLDNHH